MRRCEPACAHMPPLPTAGLRDCQVEAITNLERSLAQNRPRALIQMATGSGKTYRSVSSIYRMIKFGGAKRVLFLVDRSNLARQTLNEFQQYVTPDDGRKFTELYNVPASSAQQLSIRWPRSASQRSSDSTPCFPVSRSLIRGGEHSLFDLDDDADNQPMKEVRYNPAVPIETFDVIITDECHPQPSITNGARALPGILRCLSRGTDRNSQQTDLWLFQPQSGDGQYDNERAVADG